MSTAKRSRRRPADGRSVSPQPDAKRLKVAKFVHVPKQKGLNFLIDENAREGKKLEARLTNGVPISTSNRVDESRTIVASDNVHEEDGVKAKNRQDVIDVSSDSDSSSIDDEDDDADGNDRSRHEMDPSQQLTNGHISESEEEGGDQSGPSAQKPQLLKNIDDLDAMEEDSAPEEPTFGDLLKSRHPEPLDIGGSAPSQALVPTPDNRGLAPPSSTSLATVLTQALKTNDKDLLESCFRLTDFPSIRSTIQRLPPQHAGALLQRIAERIHKRPGRTGSLMVWIQWSLVAHGAYLSSQPDIMRKIKALTRVIRERANGLQPLLHLKGKLDLLSAQLELRRNLKESTGQTDDEDDEEAVRYVEGEDEDDWSESGEEAEPDVDQMLQHLKESTKPRVNGSASGLTNGHQGGSSDEGENGQDEHDLLDIEAEESEDEEEEKDSDEEADSEDDVSNEELSLDDSDDESEAEVRPPKHNTLNRKR